MKNNHYLQEELENVLSVTKDGVWKWNVLTGEVYFSPEWKKMLGYEVEELEDTFSTWEALLHPDDSFVKEKAVALSKNADMAYSVEFRMRCKDGSYKWILSRARSIQNDEEGNPQLIFGTHVDISNSKALINVVQEEKKRYKQLIEHASDAIFILDYDGKLVDYSNKAAEILGYSDEELKTIDVYAWEVAFSKEELKALLKSISYEPVEFEGVHRRKDGTTYDAAIRAVRIDIGENSYIYTSVRDITHFKQMELENNRINHSLKVAQEVAQLGSWDWNVASGELWFSEYLKEMFGYENQTVFENSYESFITRVHPDDRDYVTEQVGLALKREKEYNCDYRVFSKNNEIIIVNAAGKVFFDDAARPVRMIGTAQNVTKQRIDEKRLLELVDEVKEKEQTLNDYIASSTDFVWEVDKEGKYIYVSDGVKELLEYSAEELIGRRPFEFMDEQEATRVFKEFMIVTENQQRIVDLENWNMTKSGKRVCMLTNGVPVFDRNNVFRGYRGTDKDITKQKESEALIIKERNRAQQYLEMAGNLIVTLNTEGIVSLINQKGCDVLGADEADIVGKNWFEHFLQVEDLEMVKGFFNKLMQGDVEAVRYAENSIKTAKGEIRQVAWHNTLLYDKGIITGILSSGTDITEQKKSEAALKRQALIMQMASESANIGIWRLDLLSGRVEWDEKMFDIFGVTDSDAITGYDSYRERVHNEDLTTLEAMFNKALNDKSHFDTTFRIITDAQEIRYVRATGVVESDENGKSSGVIGTSLDVTAEKLHEKELQAAKERADRANEAKSEFLANMSHEIRTPLNGVIGLTDIVLGTRLDTTQYEYLSKVKQSSNALLHIINDILDYSKIEAGKLELLPSEFKLNELLRNISDLFGYKIYEKGLEFTFTVDPDTPNLLIGDELRLLQVLNNLVGNAVKFTKKGFIHIDVSFQEKHSDRVELIVSVKDSGIGINTQKQKKLFQPFEQGDSSMTKEFGGTGLGLTICKRLLDLMDGTVICESVEGKGSSFTIEVPLNYHPNQPKFDFSGVQSKHFLIVDDSPIDREYLKSIFDSWNIKTTVASDGEEAFEVLLGGDVDYLLLDWMMPKMDGLALLKKLNESAIVVNHILMITVHAKEKLLEEAEEIGLGIEGVLLKPYTPSELHDALFAQHKVFEMMHKTQTQLRVVTVKKALLVEDNETNQLVGKQLLAEYGFDVDIADNGRIGVDKAKENSYDIIFMDLYQPRLR